MLSFFKKYIKFNIYIYNIIQKILFLAGTKRKMDNPSARDSPTPYFTCEEWHSVARLTILPPKRYNKLKIIFKSKNKIK